MPDSAKLIRGAMRPLAPRETGLDPRLPRLPGIEAVIFDLYGTLLISSAGGGHKENPHRSLRLGGGGSGITDDPAFEEVYHATLREHQEKRRADGVDYPEVEIRAVWSEVVGRLGGEGLDEEAIEELALHHECLVNPVWPMPHAREALSALATSGRRLGILSNAQFYTAPAMEALFESTLDELGFDPVLRVFSFEELEGKPSLRLFETMRERLAGVGIAPERVFFLGNDFAKDVLPARAVGFRAGLFAGDARSLRLGGESEKTVVETADAVITDLAQLAGILE